MEEFSVRKIYKLVARLPLLEVIKYKKGYFDEKKCNSL